VNTIPLTVAGLTKDFGGLRAIDDVSFHVGEGELVGLIGPNGCGKSTVFNCISGLLELTSGQVELFGKNATNMRPDQVQRMGLTRTFQHTRLWREMTVIENLLVPPREQFAPNRLMSLLRPHSRIAEKERVLDAYAVLDTLQVSHMANHLASELSGGQSKLIDIGRALMGAPRCLLLDEPVAGVAAPLAEKIFQNLRDLVSEQGISVLVVEHNMDFILRAGVDRIVVMDRGRFLMEGTPDEVRQSRDVIEAYLGDPEDESV
jgi:ABC-type branched-subunit amino acid transport system ATPase component|tara:strand:+ start:1029 stop:1811 length:783 start_codon:yes stop_codon:yes gene_type:complete